MAAGTFTRGGMNFFITKKENTENDKDVPYNEDITGIVCGTMYYAWAFNTYEFQTSDQYLNLGERIDFTTNSTFLPELIALPQQTFCNSATVADLVASVEGATIAWYSDSSPNTELFPTETLTDGETYYAKISNICEEVSVSVTVTLTNTGLAAPTAVSPQVFCPGSLVADLQAEGYGIVWYDAVTGGNIVNPSDLLVDGFYYAAQQVSSCKSTVRTEVEVTVEEVVLNPPVIASPQYFCDYATLADIATDGSNIVWYSAQGALLSSTTALSNNTTYHAAHVAGTCESAARTPVLVYTDMGGLIDAPDITPVQYLSQGALIQNIVVPNDKIVWYASAAGGSPIPSSTLLSDNTVYYAAQKAGECESNKRTAVKILFGTSSVVDPTPQVFCGTNYTLADLTINGTVTWYDAATGGNILQNTTALTTTPTAYYADEGGVRTAILAYMNDKPDTPAVLGDITACTDQQYIDLTTVVWARPNISYSYFTDNMGSTSIGYPQKVATPVANTSYFVKAVNLATGCESEILAEIKVTVGSSCTFINPPEVLPYQTFCDGATVADLVASVKAGYSLVWYSSQNILLDPPDILIDGEIYYAEAEYSGNKSSRAPVIVNIAEELTAPMAASPQIFCSGSQVWDLVATGSNIVWYDAGWGGNILNSSDALTDGFYYASQKTSNGCESGMRTEVKVIMEDITLNPPVIASPQNFCDSATLADIATDGSNIVWYSGLGALLPSTTALSNATTYYAAYAAGTCESTNRTPVLVYTGMAGFIDAPVISSPQRFCEGATIQNIAVPNNQLSWYASAVGGVAIPSSALLTDNTVYYAVQKAGNCESSERVPVKILFDNPAGPEALSPQVFCSTYHTLADLEVNGSGIVWYDASTGGNMLPSSTSLTSTPTMYYVAQSAYQCETSRVGILANASSLPVVSVIPAGAYTAVNNSVVLIITDNNTNPSAGAKTATISDGSIAGIELVYGELKVTGKAAGTTSITYTSENENGCSTIVNIPVEVTAKLINDVSVMVDPIQSITYTGNGIEPKPMVKDGSTTLVEDTHYTLSYSNNTNAGTATVTITGMGGYSSSRQENFTISKATPTLAELSYDLTAQHYDGAAKSVTVEAAAGIVGLGTITVKYNGSTTLPTDADSYTVTVDIAEGTNYSAVTGLALGSFDIATTDINVGNSLHDASTNRYVLDCGISTATITVSHADPDLKVYYNGIEGFTFAVSLPTSGEHIVSYTVVDGQGNSHSYNITIVKPFAFSSIVQQRWDNTLTVINNPANNEGYTFTGYEWYYNGTLVGTGQSYSAGSDGRELPDGEYYVVLTANELSGSISTCPETVTRSAVRNNIVVYPNPVRRGNTVTVKSDLTREAGAVVELFNLSGTKVSSQPVSGDNAVITAPSYAGTYMLRIQAAGQVETFKLIVE